MDMFFILAKNINEELNTSRARTKVRTPFYELDYNGNIMKNGGKNEIYTQ